MTPQFYSIKEVAAIFGVHICTIRRAVLAGHILSLRIGEGKRSPYRISKEFVDKLHRDSLLSSYKKIRIKHDLDTHKQPSPR